MAASFVRFIRLQSSWTPSTVTDGNSVTLPLRLERIEKKLDEIRSEFEERRMERMFEQAKPLTIEEVRRWNGRRGIWLIERGFGKPGYRYFEYRHDQLNETVVMMEAPAGLSLDQEAALRRHRRRHHLDEMTGRPPEDKPALPNAFGRRHMDYDEHELKLKRLNEGVPEEKQKLWLEGPEEWEPYEFITTRFSSWTERASEIRRL